RYTLVADHYVYIASVGLIALVASALARYRAAYMVLLPLMILTFRQTLIYHDPITLWFDTVQKNPNSWMVHTNLAKSLAAAHRESEAEPHFQRALALAPNLPETHWNAGINYSARKQYQNAPPEFDRPLE